MPYCIDFSVFNQLSNVPLRDHIERVDVVFYASHFDNCVGGHATCPWAGEPKVGDGFSSVVGAAEWLELKETAAEEVGEGGPLETGVHCIKETYCFTREHLLIF